MRKAEDGAGGTRKATVSARRAAIERGIHLTCARQRGRSGTHQALRVDYAPGYAACARGSVVRRQLIVAAAALLAACASASPPPGGPEDKAPPRVLSVSPDTNAVNVHPDHVSFFFDEVI